MIPERTYRRKIFKVGGSVVVPIPKKLRNEFGIGPGDFVLLSRHELEGIMIEKEKKPWNGLITKRD